MSVHAYLFEVRAIQPFLFATGKLKDMVAGSELIDYLCSDPLANALDLCGLTNLHQPAHSPRCAGGAFYLLIDDADKARQFSYIWPMVVTQLLPSVEQVQVCVADKTVQAAMAKGLQALQTARNKHTAQHPAASPLAMRSPRTGEVAVAWDQDDPIDAATQAKRTFSRPTDSRTLVQRFCAEPGYYWPDNFETNAAVEKRFPLDSDNLVGLVHADGNGLGEILRILSEATQTVDEATYIRLYRTFSEGIDQTTCEAAQAASQKVLLPAVTNDHVMPARPLVLGGDDLTLLVKASLALPFAVEFIQQFETSSARFLNSLKASMHDCNVSSDVIDRLPAKLTACAGVTFMKHSQPFAQCYELAESLCNRAKQHSREQRNTTEEAIPSSLSFHKIQGSLIDDAEQLFNLELTTEAGLALGLPVYGVGDASQLPNYQHLETLAQCFGPNRLNEKRLRAIATLLHTDPSLAKKDYLRWRTQVARTQAGTLSQFDNALIALLGSTSAALPANADESISPLADLLMYLSIHGHMNWEN